MIKLKHILYFFGLIILFTNCKNKLINKVADIQSIDTSGIYFTYTHNDSVYYGHFSLNITDEDFSYMDDLKISISKENPKEYYFVSVIRKKWNAEEENVIINIEDNVSYYSYHDVDSKPVFATANDEFENDSAIQQYFLNDADVKETYKMVGVYILIDGYGKARLKKAMTNDNNEIEIIKERISKMPNFTPAYNGTDTVTVSYLIEIPVFN